MNDESFWPRPAYDTQLEPHFLFVLTPPYSGSTALAQLLGTSDSVAMLDYRGEGQWLVPGMAASGRWRPDRYIDFESVRAVWLHEYQQQRRQNGAIRVIVEKSPPNMLYLKDLRNAFEHTSVFVNNRNPYAACSSLFHRRFQEAARTQDERSKTFATLARDWLYRSQMLIDLIAEYTLPQLTYEEFCADPRRVLSVLGDCKSLVGKLNFEAKIHVKDYPEQGISNHNPRQIGMLRAEDIASIRQELAHHDSILDFFGYTLSPNDCR